MGRYAIFIVLSMTFALIAYGAGLQSNLNTAQERMIADYNFSQAQNLANTATMIAVNKIRDPDDNSFTPNSGQTFYQPGANSFETWDNLKGKYRIKVENVGDTLTTVTTTALVNDQEYEMQMQMKSGDSEWEPDLPFAVFSGVGIELSGSAEIVGHAGTNATNAQAVQLAWSTKIDSSLLVGPGGDPSTVVDEANFQNGNVGLTIGNLPAPVDYPLPKFPDYPPKNSTVGSMDVSAWPPVPPQPPSSYDGVYIPELSITGNSTLTLQTGGQDRVLHVGDLDIQQGHLKFEGDGNVKIYVEDELQLNGSSTLNSDRSKEKVFVYHGGTNELNFGGSTNFNSGIYTKEADVTITGSGGIQGNVITGGSNVEVSGDATANTRSLFAPNANVNVTGSGEISGAVVADRFTATGNARIYYSESFDSELPDLESQQNSYDIAYWN